jgi:LPXTG-motif cell wall-anchored protein
VGENGYDVQLIVSPTGLFVAAWEHPSTGRKIKTSSSSDGLIWSSPQDVTTLGESTDVSLAVSSNGLFIAVWEMYDGNYDIVQASSSSNGTTWSAVQNLSDSGISAADAQLTVNSDRLFVAVWEGDKSAQDSDDVIWWRSSSDGVNWSVALPVYSSDDTLDADDPQVTADSTTGRVTAAWERDASSSSGTDIIQASHITSAGGQGQGPTTPAATTTPTLAATGANVEWLFVAGLLAVVAGAGFLTISRRKRTA